ncbi:MFS transporter, partial [bacterium]|nr:MFS transporter [bacterium]
MILRRPQTILLLTIFANAADGAASVAVPLYAQGRLGASAALLGTYALVQFSLYVVSALLSGYLADRYGRRRTILLGLVIGGTGLLTAIPVDDRLLLFVPVALIGLGMGMLWPAVEAAMIDGQGSGQIKRATGHFNYSWLGARSVGMVAASVLYVRDANLPFAFSLLFIGLSGIIISLPNAMAIAPWGPPTRFDHGERVSPAKRRLFVNLALLANFCMFFTMGNWRQHLPIFTNQPEIHIVGLSYGILVGSVTVGMFFANALFMRWHGWHYSLRVFIVAQLAMVALLVLFLSTRSYPILISLAFLMGFPSGLVYYASLFYGMEQLDRKGSHGANHEALIGLGVAVGPQLGGWLIVLFQAHDWPFAQRANLL